MISIIIPAYNAEKYIERCLKSIQNQSYLNYEVIIIDDGSTDHTAEICKEWSVSDERIRYFYKKNGGSASARNYGLKCVNGDYISFIDADDYVDKNFLMQMYNCIINTKADIVQCDFMKTTSLKEIQKENRYEIKMYNNIEFLQAFCNKSSYLKTAVLWNKLYKKILFDGIEFPEKRGIDDEFVICEVIYKAKVICEINDILYYYYMSPNSQMRSAPTLKSIDNVEAIEGQLNFFKTINQPGLYNCLLYRYYSSVSGAYHLVQDYFPEQRKLLIELNKKLSTWKNVFWVKEIPFKDKILLIFRIKFPKVFKKIHMKVSRILNRSRD